MVEFCQMVLSRMMNKAPTLERHVRRMNTKTEEEHPRGWKGCHNTNSASKCTPLSNVKHHTKESIPCTALIRETLTSSLCMGAYERLKHSSVYSFPPVLLKLKPARRLGALHCDAFSLLSWTIQKQNAHKCRPCHLGASTKTDGSGWPDHVVYYIPNRLTSVHPKEWVDEYRVVKQNRRNKSLITCSHM